MTDHTLELLKKMREETQAGFAEQRAWNEKTTATLGAVAQTLVGVQRDIRDLKREVSSVKDQIGTLGAAVDEHTRRLDRIDARLGLNDPTH